MYNNLNLVSIYFLSFVKLIYYIKNIEFFISIFLIKIIDSIDNFIENFYIFFILI